MIAKRLIAAALISAAAAAPAEGQEEGRTWTIRELIEMGLVELPERPPFHNCAAGFSRPLMYLQDVAAELTQLNGPRTRAELDAYAMEFVRSHTESPDVDGIIARLMETYWDEVLEGAVAYVESRCWNGNPPGTAAEVALGEFERYRTEPGAIADLVAETLHRAYSYPYDSPPGGQAYVSFEATAALYEATAHGGKSLHYYDPERAAEVFARFPGTGGPVCRLLASMRENDPVLYEESRRETPERCPELEDPRR